MKNSKVKKQEVRKLLTTLKGIRINSDKARIGFNRLIEYRRQHIKTIDIDALFWGAVADLYHFIMNIAKNITKVVNSSIAWNVQKEQAKSIGLELEKMITTISRITHKKHR